MKKYLIAIMLALPLAGTAQDNTWERIEVEPAEKENPDARYLRKDAVPEIDGKVFFVSEEKVRVGDYVKVLVDDTLDYDLIGSRV